MDKLFAVKTTQEQFDQVLKEYSTMRPEYFTLDEHGKFIHPYVREYILRLTHRALTDRERRSGVVERTPLDMNVAERRMRAFTMATRAQIERLKLFDGCGCPSGDIASVDVWRRAPRILPKSVQEVITPFFARCAFNVDDEFDAYDRIEIDHTRTDRLSEVLDIPVEGKNWSEKLRSRIASDELMRNRLSQLIPFAKANEQDMSAHDLRICAVVPEIWDNARRPSLAGHVIGTQRSPDNRERFFVTDVLNALRRVEHINEGYDAEMVQLQKIKTLLTDLYRQITSQGDKISEADLALHRSEMNEIVERLGASQDPKKRAVCEYVDRAMKLKVVNSDTNVEEREYAASIILKNLYDGKGPLVKRIQAIERISGYIGRDVKLLRGICTKQEEPLRSFVESVEISDAKSSIGCTDRPLSPEFCRKFIDKIDERLRALSVLTYAPYLVFRQHFEKHADMLKRLLNRLQCMTVDCEQYAQVRSGVAQEYVKLYMVGKIKRLHTKLGEIYRKLSNDMHDPASLLFDLIEAKKEFKEIVIAKDVRMMDYSVHSQALYVHMDALIDPLVAKLEIDLSKQIEGQKVCILSSEEKVNLYTLLRETMKGFNFNQLVAQLDNPEFTQGEMFGSSDASDQ